MNVELDSPPPGPIPWTVWLIAEPRVEATVEAQCWVTARELGAAALGCLIEQVEARRKQERAA